MIDVKEVELHSTRKQAEDFQNGSIWRDIKAILEDWVQGIKNDMLAEDDMKEVYRFQGRAEALGHFLELPETLLNSIEFEEKSHGTGHDQTSG
jgi:hypothetical protein